MNKKLNTFYLHKEIKMTSLPVNVVNLICEWAADDEQEWIPFFCPKTHNLRYKINRRCKNFIENGDKILHNRLDSYLIEGTVNVTFINLGDTLNINFKCILFQYGKEFSIYIEFDSENAESKQGKYIYRAMIYFSTMSYGGIMYNYEGRTTNLYLNGTNYGMIVDAHYEHDIGEVSIFVEKY